MFICYTSVSLTTCPSTTYRRSMARILVPLKITSLSYLKTFKGQGLSTCVQTAQCLDAVRLPPLCLT